MDVSERVNLDWLTGSYTLTGLISESVVVIAAHFQQEAQGQSGRETQQTQIQSVQQTAAQLTRGNDPQRRLLKC